MPGNEDVVRAITVGSECLYRGTLPADKLLQRIQQVQKTFHNVQVGTVDSWNKFNDGSADPIIQGGVTYLLANGFAYWQSQNINNATNTYFDDMSQAMHHIQDVAGDNKDQIRFGNGETGWPTGKSLSLSLSLYSVHAWKLRPVTDGGSNYGAATASTANAERYWQEAVCGILAWGVDVFYFEAFDESWKPESKGDNGQMMNEKHWGLLTDDRKPKFNMTCPK